ncbi:MAG TPA: amidase family protein [Candidatus Thermoplasmatota archaeon]|nr:amidase family protein [Candidatus Thermoplasmatota archaeon]
MAWLIPRVALFTVLLLATGCASPGADLAPADAPRAVAPSDCFALVGGLDLQTATIQELQLALEAGRVTSVELVDAYAARIAAFDSGGPKVNSVQGIDPTARAAAAQLDAERAAGHVRGSLHGIPILLKDNVGTSTMPTTAGSIALAQNVPADDATLTARLRESGAIVLGKTKLSEFANWVSLSMPNGYSSLGGQVVNAYTGGDPSGSSSGSGVAGSMAFAAATIGTETSGSILGPSDANSLVGVKPTVGLVSRAGVIPLAASFDTPGPMGRSVADVAAILSVIAGPDEADAATAPSGAALPPGGDYTAALSTDALQGARVGYDPQYDGELFQAALADIEAQGATLVPIDTSQLETVGIVELGLIPNEFKSGLNEYLATQAGPDVVVKDLTEIILYNQQHPDKVKYGQDLLLASDASPGVGLLMAPAALPVIRANAALADRSFAQNSLDVLVGPSLAYVSIGAAAGYPTVIVPAGYRDVDPQGISFFGPAWSEARLLGYAYAYEQASHRRLPPTSVNPSLLDGVCI